MKRIFTLIVPFFVAVAVNAQSTTPVTIINQSASSTTIASEDLLVLKEVEFDFGKIPQGKPVFTYFEIKTTTKDSLKLELVQAGCGCTTPEFKAGTYAPGEPVKIKIGYNAAGAGNFTKPVTITYNGGQQKVINITGTVEPTPATPAPANGGLEKVQQ